MDELNTPLGQRSSPERKPRRAGLAGPALGALLGVAITAVILWPMANREPPPPPPVAEAAPPVAALDEPVTTQSIAVPDKDVPAQPPPGTQTVTIIDGLSGKRQEVIVGSAGGGGRKMADPRLLEPSQHGPLPRIAADGQRPSEAYARKLPDGQRHPDTPQIAIVIGGLGASTKATANALSKLPGAVTLAFTPYGTGLDTLVAQARDKGHEVLLQVPMEPLDFPDNDPGPNTLLSSLPAEQNVGRLHWLLSRMQSYVGVTNLMGARFTASDAALTPALHELAKRGLIYVEDGSSQQSRAGAIASDSKLPYAKADVTIDAVPNAAEIDKALKRLETMAQDDGVAVGYASALPISIERIARWAKAAQSRGIVLVPITAATLRARST